MTTYKVHEYEKRFYIIKNDGYLYSEWFSSIKNKFITEREFVCHGRDWKFFNSRREAIGILKGHIKGLKKIGKDKWTK